MDVTSIEAPLQENPPAEKPVFLPLVPEGQANPTSLSETRIETEQKQKEESEAFQQQIITTCAQEVISAFSSLTPEERNTLDQKNNISKTILLLSGYQTAQTNETKNYICASMKETLEYAKEALQAHPSFEKHFQLLPMTNNYYLEQKKAIYQSIEKTISSPPPQLDLGVLRDDMMIGMNMEKLDEMTEVPENIRQYLIAKHGTQNEAYEQESSFILSIAQKKKAKEMLETIFGIHTSTSSEDVVQSVAINAATRIAQHRQEGSTDIRTPEQLALSIQDILTSHTSMHEEDRAEPPATLRPQTIAMLFIMLSPQLFKFLEDETQQR